MSLPHFYKGDPSLVEDIEGLKPDEKIHGTKVIIQPVRTELKKTLDNLPSVVHKGVYIIYIHAFMQRCYMHTIFYLQTYE